MKSSEVVNNKTIAEAPIFSTGRPEVFLDMDGVVADFFGEYAKMAKAENYRTIPGELRGPVLDKMIGSDFFYRLPKFPTADKLVDMLTKTFGHYNICSSPLRGDHENSDQMKRAWIKENLNPQPKRIVITPNKPQMAPAVQADGTPNILIDDRNTNITQWEQAGGLGIKYQADEDGLDVVVNGIKRAFEVIRGQRKHEPQDIVSKEYGGDTIATNDKQDVAEAGAETSWSNDTDKITLQDILELTKDIKQINLPINDNLKSKLLHWDGNPEEMERVNQVTVSNQFPILIMVDEQGQIEWILDGNHRLHRAIQSQAKTIPAKLIKPSNLNDNAKKIFNIKEQGVAEGLAESTLSDHEDELREFVKWTCDKLKIKEPPRIEFQDSKDSEPQTKTAHFDPTDKIIWIYTGNRNLADIMRSVAHELTHRKQDEKGQVNQEQNYPGSPIEQQADAVAGYLMKLYLDKKPGSLE